MFQLNDLLIEAWHIINVFVQLWKTLKRTSNCRPNNYRAIYILPQSLLCVVH